MTKTILVIGAVVILALGLASNVGIGVYILYAQKAHHIEMASRLHTLEQQAKEDAR